MIVILTALKGYYDGNKIVLDENDQKSLNARDEVVVTILDKLGTMWKSKRAEKRKNIVDLDKYVISTERSAEEIDDYIRELRDNDRC